MVRTKIIATVGPASASPEVLGELIGAGVDVFRLNFSHGAPTDHAQAVTHIREAARRRGTIVGIMGDLCGPKIRVAPVESDGFPIAAGASLDIVPGHVLGGPRQISTNRPELIGELAVGHRVFIEDGLIRLRVEKAEAKRLQCLCEVGGTIRSRKGINLPDTDLAMSALTDKDRQDVAWAIGQDVDWLALSFVRRAADVQELRSLLRQANSDCPIVAKIETPQAIQNLDGIIEATDAVLVARGDLGVEMDIARLPLLQKDMTARCSKAGKPVIVATEMLQSMVEHATATRAEVTDVANAIFDATDCLMLSAETSVGAYPVESVRMMSRIAQETEAYLSKTGAFARMDADETLNPTTSAVAHGAALLARELNAGALVVFTDTGRTVRLLSKCRPDRPVIGLSPEERVCRRMALYYGVEPVHLPALEQADSVPGTLDRLLLDRRIASTGDTIIVLARAQRAQPQSTKALLIHQVGHPEEGTQGPRMPS